jgi:rhodanese-related sulfurtransferase
MCITIVAAAPGRLLAAESEVKIVSTDELRAMMNTQQPLTLVDTRTHEEFQEAHIKGAIGIPEKGFETASTSLPADKGSLMVLYCNGVKCGKSKKAAKKAASMGYTNVVVYAEGFPVWEERGLPIVAGPEYGKKIETTKMQPQELKRLLDAQGQGVVIVDVRDESEFKEGHIPTALNIPVETFAIRSGVLPKEKKVVVYCNTGGRSYNAYRKLIKLAYPSIYQTTFAEWKDAGMPVEQ